MVHVNEQTYSENCQTMLSNLDLADTYIIQRSNVLEYNEEERLKKPVTK